MGTAINGENFFFKLYFEFCTDFSIASKSKKQLDIFAKSNTAPPPIATIKSGLKLLILKINFYKTSKSGSELFL